MEATTTSEYQSERAATINSVVKVLQHVYPSCGGAGVDRLTANVSNTGSATNVRGVVATLHSVRFDYNGDPV